MSAKQTVGERISSKIANMSMPIEHLAAAIDRAVQDQIEKEWGEVVMAKVTNEDAKKRLEAGEFEVVDLLPLPQLYHVAEMIGADTSRAKRLRGVGFQYHELETAIRDRVGLKKATRLEG